jgi:hypothetical protein
MKRIFTILTVLAVLTVAGAVCAETISVVNEKSPAVIPYSQSQEFQLPMLTQANTTVLLRIKSRMDFNSLGGSMHFMRLTLNGHDVLPTKGRLVSRLINKPLDSPVGPGLSYSWYAEKNGWNVLYAPDFQAAYSQKHYVDDPYVYVLDVTDMINPIAESRLKITNTATEAFLSGYKDSFFKDQKGLVLDLVIGSLEIEIKPVSSPMMGFKEAASVSVINRGESAAGAAKYRGELLPGGGFALHMGKNTYRFSSSFSYPDAGFNQLTSGIKATGNQKGFTFSVKGNRVTAQGPDYTIIRTVNFRSSRVQILDTIKNRRDTPLGLSVRHELDLNKLVGAPVRLAGNPDPSSSEYHSFGNPSVHIVTPEGGMGFIAEDDVLRHQALLYVRSDEKVKSAVAGLRTEMLRLAPGETYTLEWSVYPVAGPDYYDFINLVRKDWGANYTALGPWRWGLQDDANLSVDQVRDIIKSQQFKYFMESDWALWKPDTRIALGTDVFSDYWAPYRKSRLETIKKLHQASPDIKTVWYFNSRRETADDTLKRFSDSLMTDEHGNPLTTYWPNCGATNPSYTMVPTLKNSFGKAMLDTARRYLDEVKLDGIYWDEVEGMQFNVILYTNNMFDGHSCLLDPKTWRIQREVGIVPLLEHGFYREVTRIVHGEGKILLGNGPTGFKTTLQDRVQRMTEIQHNDTYAFEGNLQTPLGYMSWSNSWDDFLNALRQAMLPAVCIATVLPHDISQHLFPFTPIELHSGYMLGKERIVATHSGNYGWAGQHSLVKVWHLDSNGKLTATDFATTLKSDARTSVDLKPKEAVVLERLPVSFKPSIGKSGWNARVEKVIYGAEQISLSLNAPLGGVLKIDNGVFALKNGASLNVRLNQKSRAIKVMNGALNILVPAKFSGTIYVGQK